MSNPSFLPWHLPLSFFLWSSSHLLQATVREAQRNPQTGPLHGWKEQFIWGSKLRGYLSAKPITVYPRKTLSALRGHAVEGGALARAA